MNSKKKNRRQRMIHCVAHCLECEKSWEGQYTARAKAYAHHRNTGHTVSGEVAYAFHFK